MPHSVVELRLAALAPLVALLAPATVLGQALPFQAPGDSRLRHMIELDTDDDRMPLSTTWPLPSADLRSDERDAMRGYNQPGSATDAGWFLSGAAKPTRLRTFSDTPREKGEAGLQAGWTAGDYAGGAIRVSYAFSPQDGMHYRFDGTYAAWRLGNWWLTAGFQDRWWGPGWDGSLILSNNARPMPGLGLERNSSVPFNSKWLSWLGPWRFVTFVDHMENHRPDFNNTLFWGARLTFAPLDSLEIGLSRTAEFCGQNRPCGLSTFFDMLTAKSNRAVNANGSQTQTQLLQKRSAQTMAGDVRWHPGRLPVAIYWQEFAEVFDDRNLRPRQLLQLFGIEFASPDVASGRLRMFLEFADTACGAIGFNSGDKPGFGCAYEKDTWRAGYRYRGRVIGDSMDRDGRSFTLGGIVAYAPARSVELRLRHFDLNRGNIAQIGLLPQTVTTAAEKLWNGELKVDGPIGEYRYSIGAGADHGGPIGERARWNGRFFLSVSKNW